MYHNSGAMALLLFKMKKYYNVLLPLKLFALEMGMNLESQQQSHCQNACVKFAQLFLITNHTKISFMKQRDICHGYNNHFNDMQIGTTPYFCINNMHFILGRVSPTTEVHKVWGAAP